MAIISEKTRQFIKGRIHQFKKMEEACNGQENIIWVHSASYGEFEEVTPVLEAIRRMHPEVKFLATFFSPSGYEHHKNNPVVDWVFYLPLDTTRNARRFLDIVRPVKVIVSISDYWLHFLRELRSRKIETYLVAARFQDGMRYFKPLGYAYKDAFKTCFTKIIVKLDTSRDVLEKNGIHNVAVCGDPRIDRVVSISEEKWNDEIVEKWNDGKKVFVAGSTLPDEDEEFIVRLANSHPEHKFILVPHESSQAELKNLQKSIKGRTVLYSKYQDNDSDARVLIVDVVGKLSRIYRYGFASYVGGGFDGCPHSVVESAAYGVPVAFGPEMGVNEHCYALNGNGGLSVGSYSQLEAWYDRLLGDEKFLQEQSKAAYDYCRKNGSVAEAIAKEIFK